MTREVLEQYSLVSLYSAIVVLTLAMLGFIVYLARSAAAAPRDAVEPARADVLVGAGGPAVHRSPDGPGDDAASASGLVKARKAAGPARMLTGLATLLVGVSILFRGLSVHRPPLGNLHEFVAAASFVLLLSFCLWGLKRNVDWLGAFVTAPVLLMLGSATTFWYTEAAQLMPSLKSGWLVIHVTVATISVGVFTLAAMVGLAYLLVDRAEARGGGAPGRLAGLRRVLPPAPELERLSYGLHVIAFPLWTFTLIAGAIWARQAWASYWNWDPKEVWTFVIWVVYAAYLHARATTGISRQKATYIALAGFACIIINYSIVNMYFVGQHSYSGV
ncbi:MAG: c-type cytochrome biogenesis protein CcsB [Actinobacteria bacterium]|uniref:C-type cytochrome biogenesis protein CcsB n=1 Tax=Nostocoides veronense TaxID=330836 RepID=A0ABP4XJA2_9MICO|nr:c-type cytochrome biogenesis protein CcsB [Actinomycetota bacterium]